MYYILDCGCHRPGTIGGLGVCDLFDGQCACKPFVGKPPPGDEARVCSACKDGYYGLEVRFINFLASKSVVCRIYLFDIEYNILSFYRNRMDLDANTVNAMLEGLSVQGDSLSVVKMMVNATVKLGWLEGKT